MNNTEHFSIKNHSVHLWHVQLTDFLIEVPTLSLLLNSDEIQRAERFRFEEHKQRYIVARAMLRNILGLYSKQAPKEIIFTYGVRGKPYLLHNPHNLQFNLSHSHDVAVYGITTQHEMGVDVEKIADASKEDIAKRFFSQEEYHRLMQLPAGQRSNGFYQLWSRKEAVIKAIGEGLYAPLHLFTVAMTSNAEFLNLIHQGNTLSLHVENFATIAGYQAAFATIQQVKEILHWRWDIKDGVVSLDDVLP